MTIYDIFVADEILAEFNNENPRMPEGFRIVGSADGPVNPGTKRFRVEDDSAPAWTDGKLIMPVLTTEYEKNDKGWTTDNILRVTVTDWIEVTE